jgi:hypothetical protein
MCKFLHIRNHNEDGTISGRGGSTIAYNTLGAGIYVYAAAFCHNNDNFCKHTGRAKAAGRLKSKNQFFISEFFPTEKDFVQFLLSEYSV